jgi:integrase
MTISNIDKWIKESDAEYKCMITVSDADSKGEAVKKGMYRWFYDKMSLEGLTERTKSTHLANLKRLTALAPKADFRDLTKHEIEELQLELTKKYEEPATVKIHVLTIRKWLNVLEQEDRANSITKVKGRSKKKLREELITEAEREALLKSCAHPRDSAIIALLSDSGCRVGELVSMQVKHCKFNEHGAIVSFPEGKTGARENLVIFAASYLRVWLDAHEYADNPDAPLFYSSRCEYKNPGLKKSELRMPANRIPIALDEDGVRQQLRNIAKKAGIKRRVHPHLFRHTRATQLAPHMPESLMNINFGWSEKSQTARVYSHVDQEDVHRKILSVAGIEVQEEEVITDEPVRCSRCKEINNHYAEFCFKCGLPLSADALAKIEAERQREAQDKDDLKAALEAFKKEKAELEALKADIRAMTYRTNESGDIESITGMDNWARARVSADPKQTLEDIVTIEATKKQLAEKKQRRA